MNEMKMGCILHAFNNLNPGQLAGRQLAGGQLVGVQLASDFFEG